VPSARASSTHQKLPVHVGMSCAEHDGSDHSSQRLAVVYARTERRLEILHA
jgi:hypothetical protein